MTDKATLLELAGGLTRAQRKAILEAVWVDDRAEYCAFAMFLADRNLREKGLINGWCGALTPLGKELRTHLHASQK